MQLYHFTCQELLPAIVADGLQFGDTPTSPSEGINAVWFTTQFQPHRQKWTEGGALDKKAIRLTVEFDEADTLLEKWTDFAAKNIEPTFYKNLDRAGGGHSGEWYIYHGVIPWQRVIAVKLTNTHKEIPPSSIVFSSEEIEASRELNKEAEAQLQALKLALAK